jgi:hypothetical protein
VNTWHRPRLGADLSVFGQHRSIHIGDDVTAAPTTPAIPTTTRAAVIYGYGGPEALVAAEVELPALTGTRVLVDVAAVTVNPVDLTTRAGVAIAEKDARFPMVLGCDVAAPYWRPVPP